jgi:hypothetical protein
MAVSMPVCLRICAKAATSPIQLGTEGCDSGVVWTVTVESIILKECPPFEKKLFWVLSLSGDTFFRSSASLSSRSSAYPVDVFHFKNDGAQ